MSKKISDNDLENNFIRSSADNSSVEISKDYQGIYKNNIISTTTSPKDSVGSSDSDFIINIDLNSENYNINNIDGGKYFERLY